MALKQAAEAWLPAEIVNRPKASFSAPLRAWIPVTCSRDGRRRARRRRTRRAGVAPAGRARSAWSQDDAAGREDRSKQIWQLLTLELWCRQAQPAGVAT